jgi:transposase
MQFGRKSEKLERQIGQLELRLEDLQQSQPAESAPASEAPHPSAAASTAIDTPAKPARRALPAQLPRRTQTHLPKSTTCPDCGGELRKLGEDISEMLDYLPANFVVIRHVRPKLSCGHCQRIVQASAPSRPIARGVAGPGLLAHVLVSKYCDHLPLYRQSEIYERVGVELERSTLADWVGGSSQLLEPLVEALRRYVMAADKLHADDTPLEGWAGAIPPGYSTAVGFSLARNRRSPKRPSEPRPSGAPPEEGAVERRREASDASGVGCSVDC